LSTCISVDGKVSSSSEWPRNERLTCW